MQDAALNLVRPLFATLPGVSAPPPFGGSARTILVNAKPERLHAYNMSPDELVTALTAANTISPSGDVPLGDNSFAVISVLPAALAGVVLALWITGTTLNIQSFMGAIMSVGVAVSNAILLVTFA